MREAFIRRLPELFGPKNYVWWSNPPSPYGRSGRPDIEVISKGHFYGIEFKSGRHSKNPIGGLTEEQAATLLKILKAGGEAWIVADAHHPMIVCESNLDQTIPEGETGSGVACLHPAALTAVRFRPPPS